MIRKILKRNPIKFVFVVCIVILVFIGILIYGLLFYLSDWGTCKLGETLYSDGVTSEQCRKIGTKAPAIDTGDDEKDVQGTLVITETYWTGWEDGGIEEKVVNYEIASEEDYSLPEFDNFKVIDHTKSEITIKIYGLSVKQGKDLSNSGINLNNCKNQTVIIKKEEIIEADTCTLDGGINWKIKYE